MNITHVVVNGKEVWEEIERSGLATFEDVKKITYGARETSCTLRIGFGQGSKFLGWTTNLQSGYGSNANEFINRLGDWLCENK
jgi:hypothetical protein